MRMSKLGYFAEFLVFPPFIVVLTILGFNIEQPPSKAAWTSAFLAGLVVWTLLEYLLHRYVFHNAPLIAPMHEQHHRSPLELIGAPAWASLIAGILVLIPLWLTLDLGLGSAVTAGLAVGYLWYVVVHYAAHHWEPQRGSYFYRTRMLHARHHYAPDLGNFGVTSDIWDRVFGTLLDRQVGQSWSAWLWGYLPGTGRDV